ncbi:hypothetical protein QFC19_001359 [Naganishia cerealis]|uniref:Uncharacterized protein n=1 Tax=Naganishia cerealis TaxID=610337 RepID=A0ACC2WI39_9TREE|nr:hypothetical protein QFC19_001359 [Naganishia cerealis]
MAKDDDSDDGSTDQDRPYIEPVDVIRHYWTKGNIRYCVVIDGRRQYMTADEMDDSLGGVNYALWHYWKAKRPGRRTGILSALSRKSILVCFNHWRQLQLGINLPYLPSVPKT